MGFYNPDNTKKSKEQINFEIKKINILNKEFWDGKDRNNHLEKYIVALPPAEPKGSPPRETKSFIWINPIRENKTSLKIDKEQPKEEIEIKITRPKRKFNLGE